MYILTFTDKINCSSSNLHVSDDTELVSYNEDLEKLKEYVKEQDKGCCGGGETV